MVKSPKHSFSFFKRPPIKVLRPQRNAEVTGPTTEVLIRSGHKGPLEKTMKYMTKIAISKQQIYLVQLIITSIAISTVFLLTSCAKKTDADKVGEAQSCIDNSTAATVSSCVEKVDGLTSSESYTIRCAAKLIKEGFDNPTKLLAAVENLDNNSGSTSNSNGTLGLMATLSFTSASTPEANRTSAEEAYSYCLSSGSKGLYMLAAFARMATDIAAIANTVTGLDCLQAGQTCSATQLESAINNATVADASAGVVGAVALTVYETNCSGGQSQNEELCNTINSAVAEAGGSLDPDIIGAALLSQLTQP